MRQFGAELFVADLVGLSILRELGHWIPFPYAIITRNDIEDRTRQNEETAVE